MHEKVIDCIVKATNRADLKNIGPDELFVSHDIDSLDQMTIMVEVESAFGIELEDVEPKEVNSVNAYVRLVKEKLGS